MEGFSEEQVKRELEHKQNEGIEKYIEKRKRENDSEEVKKDDA